MNYSYKQIWLIAYPVMMSFLIEQLINITDALFLGHVGEIELGASALAGIWFLAIYMLGLGFSVGLQVVIARRNGEQKYEETGKTFFQGLCFLLILASLLCLLSKFFSPQLLKYLITSPEVYNAVVKYLDWRIIGLFFSFPFLAIRSFLVGITETKPLNLAALTAVLMNIPLNWLLIFRYDMGISGAAIGSSFAELCSLLILVAYMFLCVRKHKYGLSWRIDIKILKEVFSVSVWSMLQFFTSVAIWFLFFIAIERLGEIELAVSNIVRSVSALFSVIVTALGAVTSSLVSNSIGAGERNAVFPLCHRIRGFDPGLSAQDERRGPQAGEGFCAGRAVRDLPVLSSGKYRAYLYACIQCGGHHLGGSVFYGNIVKAVHEVGGEAGACFFHWIRGGDDRHLDDQLERFRAGAESGRGYTGASCGFCVGLLFYFDEKDRRLRVSGDPCHPQDIFLWDTVYGSGVVCV